ncbi:MAG: hypothetical protein JW958_13730 [Candidatus Eisenbacteria bacterium]|nr:hypothetical protein [Candidatus Eisenbacteria bacterium]
MARIDPRDSSAHHRERADFRARLLAVFFISTAVSLAGCGRDAPKEEGNVAPGMEAAAAEAALLSGKRILLVHSYHADYPWVDAITRGVRWTLKGTGIDLRVFYMDTKRNTGEEWKRRAGERAFAEAEAYGADLVLTVDDNAQRYLGERLVGGSRPVVFCGVNGEPADYGYPAPNVTGVVERLHFRRTLDLLARLRPYRRIAILSSDDPTSAGAIAYMRTVPVDVDVVEWILADTFTEWKEAVRRFNRTVDAFGVYSYHTIHEEGDSTSLDPQTVMEWTRRNASVPTFGFSEFGIEDGLLVGVAVSGFEHGEKAAQYALEILRGTPIERLPVIEANVGTPILNQTTADKLGLAVDPSLAAEVRFATNH